MKDFKNKKLIVVGGSSGIGLETSLNLRRKGAEIHVWSRNPHHEFEAKEIRYAALDVSQPISDALPSNEG